MDIKTTAIILCAGVGSRMGISDPISKCSIPIRETSAVRHTAAALAEAGADQIVVVTGYAPESVVSALAGLEHTKKIVFVHNPHYSLHGCNYSLACAAKNECAANAERIVIAEGDSILHKLSVKKLLCSKADAASLVRDASYADYSRSVLAVGSEGKILRFEYDASHSGRLPMLLNGETVIGESMQLWSFSGGIWKRLKEQLHEYFEMAGQSSSAFTHSGVYSINQLSSQIEPIFSDYPDQWINLNTQQDLKKASAEKWLIK